MREDEMRRGAISPEAEATPAGSAEHECLPDAFLVLTRI